MLRRSTRSLLRASQSSLAPGRTAPSRRFLSTDPPHLKRRSWKTSAARWGIAIAGIYYYNTSPVFAEEPSTNLLNPTVDALEDTSLPTLGAASPSTKRQYRSPPSIPERTFVTASENNASMTTSSQSLSPSSSESAPTPDSPDPSTAPSDLEEEADQQGAFNPETGEINWDCPCLGGMAHGPCGPEFREAFSCFVFSKEEPKGMECIDKFKGMQECFKEHPDVYKGELEDEESEELDEGLRSEKEAVERPVQDRRAAYEQKENDKSQSIGGKRLLELDEAPPPHPRRPSSPPKPSPPQPNNEQQVSTDVSRESYTEKETDTKAPAQAPSAVITKSSPTQNKATEISRPASSEPHPGMSEDHSHDDAPRKERAARRSEENKNMNKFDQNLELMPKPWHDATDKNKGKEEKKKA